MPNLTLQWDASPSTGINGYKVYQGITSGGPYKHIRSTDSLQVTLLNLNVADGDYFVVTAFIGNDPENPYRESGYSNEVRGYLQIDPPTNLRLV